MRRDLILCLGAGCLGFAGAMIIGRAQGQPVFSNETAPRVVVAMTSHEGTTIIAAHVHLYRVWSDGYTDWNCRRVSIADGRISWRGWESINESTGPWCGVGDASRPGSTPGHSDN